MSTSDVWSSDNQFNNVAAEPAHEVIALAPGEIWTGTDAADTKSGTANDDTLEGAGGNDFLSGGTGDDSLFGNNDSDTLAGGIGNDLLEGGTGFDFVTYAEANSAVTVSLRNPVLNVGAYAAGDIYYSIQGVIGSDFDDHITGDLDTNHLTGGEGSDTLDGGAGADTLEGGAGNDVYIDPLGDTIIDLSGFDTIRTSQDFALAESLEIENLVALDPAGSADLKLLGNGRDNTLIGTRGDNLLDGKGGRDVLLGGLGDDIYMVDHTGDQVREGSSGGSDTVIVSTSYALSGDAEIEILKLMDATSRASFNLSGSNSANAITGGAGNNVLKGYGGNDVLRAESGVDNIYGGTGNDTIFGGAGADRLYGEAGRDKFEFDTKPSKTNVDRIYKYSVKDDTIWLDDKIFTKLGKGSVTAPKKVKSGMFTNGDKAKDSSDRIIYDAKTGSLYYDKDGTGASGKVKVATLDKNLKLTYHDFFVI